eukprot:CAMPEP_0117422932 /NCGR_PEP_ID=MMETSP0758-20121206/3689_1 /TAXON_ID=63605 /ORGANISM="Percolomonas cosmopolitus, Strain AE-1 (ATCC 50343)" /LENGTH=89 /DNA_ID=CAMNT_0005205881 /DNA_START=2479 /DNA_END=2748 /DNA_ORIENTATION=+
MFTQASFWTVRGGKGGKGGSAKSLEADPSAVIAETVPLEGETLNVAETETVTQSRLDALQELLNQMKTLDAENYEESTLNALAEQVQNL